MHIMQCGLFSLILHNSSDDVDSTAYVAECKNILGQFKEFKEKFIRVNYDRICSSIGNDADSSNVLEIFNTYDENFVKMAEQYKKVKDNYFFAIFFLGTDQENISRDQVCRRAQIIWMEIPNKYYSNLKFSLFTYKLRALMNEKVMFLMLKEHEYFLMKWKIYQETDFIFGEGIFRYENCKINYVGFQDDTYIAIEHIRKTDSTSAQDEEYIEYLRCIMNHYHCNLPAIKGLIIPQEGPKLRYPLLIMECCESIQNVTDPVKERNQVSFLLDIAKSVAYFQHVNRSIHMAIDLNFVCFHVRESKLIAKLIPLYGFNFIFDSQPESPDMQWMMNVTKRLHFGENFKDQELPDNHLLKKLLEQQWLSIHQQFNYKKLSEDLQDLQGIVIIIPSQCQNFIHDFLLVGGRKNRTCKVTHTHIILITHSIQPTCHSKV